MKTLVVFDFDDTLFRSGAMIGVQKPGSPKRYLSSHEYATYTAEEGEEFDYEQFQVYPPQPEPIKKSTERLESSVASQGIRNVIILTARSSSAPVRKVLQNFGMPEVEIFAIGSAAPEDKAAVVEDLINKRGYKRVVVYEDSSPNIAAIRNRVKPLLGKNFTAFKVKATPRGEVLQKESRKAVTSKLAPLLSPRPSIRPSYIRQCNDGIAKSKLHLHYSRAWSRPKNP